MKLQESFPGASAIAHGTDQELICSIPLPNAYFHRISLCVVSSRMAILPTPIPNQLCLVSRDQAIRVGDYCPRTAGAAYKFVIAERRIVESYISAIKPSVTHPVNDANFPDLGLLPILG
ncbi:hypothetical protein [Nostoc sp.]